MSLFDRWQRRLIAADPQEPASPPPFTARDRVVVSPQAVDGMFLGGRHGIVTDIEFTTDPEDVFGPWIVSVILDDDPQPMKFHAAELTREHETREHTEAVTVAVTQPEDDEPVPYTPVVANTDSLAPWIQRAKELRYETVFTDTPVFDDVVSQAMAADGLAAEVSAYLADVAGGAR
jgi:hypothetical protein